MVITEITNCLYYMSSSYRLIVVELLADEYLNFAAVNLTQMYEWFRFSRVHHHQREAVLFFHLS